MVTFRHLWLATVAVAAIALGCTPGRPVTPTGARVARPGLHYEPGATPVPAGRASAFPTAAPAVLAASTRPATPSPLASVPVAVPSGAGSVADHGAGLVGTVTGPPGILTENGAGLISDGGSGVVSNNAGNYGLLDVAEAPYPGATVTLVDALGHPVLDGAGKPIAATTDASGAYHLPFAGRPTYGLLQVQLPGDRGRLISLVPRGNLQGPTRVDVNYTSTLVMGYILDQYVQGNLTVLEKLPEKVEADTRVITAAALSAGKTAVPDGLSPVQIVRTVEQLRAQAPTVDHQLEYVKSLLLAGLSNQGIGRLATENETDAAAVAVGPDGAVYFVGSSTLRVWKIGADGRLAAVAGSGRAAPYDAKPASGDPAPGDGGPALEAPFAPMAVAFDKAGALYVLDGSFGRVRKVAADGTISTYASHPEWTVPRALAFEPDGSLLVATQTTLDRVSPDGQIARVAGAFNPDPNAWLNDPTGALAVGDGGPPAAARFDRIDGIAVDPASDAIYIEDGRVRRIADGVIQNVPLGTPAFGGQSFALLPDGALVLTDFSGQRVVKVVNGQQAVIAGSGVEGHTGDGGPATSATMCHLVGCAAGPDGAIYVSDDGEVREIAGGTIRAVAGRFDEGQGVRPPDQVALRRPQGLTFDAAHHALLIGEMEHMRRLALDGSGLQVIAGKGSHNLDFADGQAALEADLVAFGNAVVEPDGALDYVVGDQHYDNWLVRQQDGVLHVLAGGPPPAGQARYLFGPAVGAGFYPAAPLVKLGDTFYYAFNSHGLVAQFTPGADVKPFAGGKAAPVDGGTMADFGFGAIASLAAGPDGRLYVGTEDGHVWAIDLAKQQVFAVAGSTYGFGGDGGPARQALLTKVTGLAFDARGRLYVSDHDNNRIRRVDPSAGTIETVAGEGSGNLVGKDVDTGLSSPNGLAFDDHGDLYICDEHYQQIKHIAADRL